MRVLAVAASYPLRLSGGTCLPPYVLREAESLRDRGIQVDTLAIDGLGSRFNYVKAMYHLRKRLSQQQYDLIHGYYVYCGMVARSQWELPVIVSYLGSDVLRGRLEPSLSRLLARMADAVIVVSQEMKSVLGAKDAFVIPTGIDLNRFRPVPMGEARERLGLDGQKRLVLFLHSDRPVKRFDLAQLAFGVLQKRDTQAELLVVDNKPPEVIPLYMNACDVILLTSDSEGSPNVIKEAMACNLPIVSVPVGDVAQVVGNTRGCYLCSRDPADIADKVELALSFNGRTEGRASVEHLSLDRIADRIVEVYRQAMDTDFHRAPIPADPASGNRR